MSRKPVCCVWQGAHSDVYIHRRWLCGQLTSSAIHNERLGWMAMSAIDVAAGGLNTLCPGGFRFQHAFTVENNNYGVVETSAQPNGEGRRMEFYSVVGQGAHEEPKVIRYVPGPSMYGEDVARPAAVAAAGGGISRSLSTVAAVNSDGVDDEQAVCMTHAQLMDIREGACIERAANESEERGAE